MIFHGDLAIVTRGPGPGSSSLRSAECGAQKLVGNVGKFVENQKPGGCTGL